MQGDPGLVRQAHPLDDRRGGVPQPGERHGEERVHLPSRRTRVEVEMARAIERADRLAGFDDRAAPEADGPELSVVIPIESPRPVPGSIEWPVGGVPSHPQMDVLEEREPDPLTDTPHSDDRQWL